MNYSDDLCSMAKFIVSDDSFRILLSLELMLGLCAALINLIVISLIWRAIIFHANLRCLLVFHSFNLGLYSGSTAIRALYFLIVGAAFEKPCQLVTSLYNCRVQELINIVPLISSLYGLLALSLERLYATIRYRTYDSASTFPWLGILLIPMVYIIVLANQLAPLTALPMDKYMPVCASLLTMPPRVAAGVLAQNVCINCVGVILAFSLYVINKRKLVNSVINRAHHSLAARFQISQNVSVNQLLLPSMIAHTVYTIPSSIGLFLLTNVLDLSFQQKHFWLNLIFCFPLCLSIFHPVLALTRNPHIKKLLMNSLPSWWKYRIGSIGTGPLFNSFNSTEAHFRSLETMWSAQKD